MKNIFICFLLCIVVAGFKAQAGFVKSYIITEKGDTIRGEAKINPKKENDVYDKIFFKDEAGVQKTYKANKILGYGAGEDNFIALDNDGEPKFYKVLARGEINLYTIVFETMQMNEVSYDPEYYISRPDNKKLVVVKQSKFKKQLSDWMKDNPEFLASYEDEKKLNAEKAVAVISQYNSWKAGK